MKYFNKLTIGLLKYIFTYSKRLFTIHEGGN